MRHINAVAHCKIRTGMGYLVLKNLQVIKLCVLGGKSRVAPILINGKRHVFWYLPFCPRENHKAAAPHRLVPFPGRLVHPTAGTALQPMLSALPGEAGRLSAGTALQPALGALPGEAGLPLGRHHPPARARCPSWGGWSAPRWALPSSPRSWLQAFL